MGRLVDLAKAPFVGQLALKAEQAKGGPARRLVGVSLDWNPIERLYGAQDLPPAISPSIDRSPVPAFAPGGAKQIGKVTSHGWSPVLKRAIGLASVSAQHEAGGTR